MRTTLTSEFVWIIALSLLLFLLFLLWRHEACSKGTEDIIHIVQRSIVGEVGCGLPHPPSLGVGVDIEHVRQRVGDKLSRVCSRTVGAQVGAGDCLWHLQISPGGLRSWAVRFFFLQMKAMETQNCSLPRSYPIVSQLALPDQPICQLIWDILETFWLRQELKESQSPSIRTFVRS